LKAHACRGFSCCREEIRTTPCQGSQPRGVPLKDVVKGLSLSQRRRGASCTTLPRRRIRREHGRPCRFVAPVYRARSQDRKTTFIGYLKHPYVSFYTGRGLPLEVHLSACGPQTVGGQPLPGLRSAERTSSAEVALDQGEHAGSEGDHVRRNDHLHRTRRIWPRVGGHCAAVMGELGMTWEAANAKGKRALQGP